MCRNNFPFIVFGQQVKKWKLSCEKGRVLRKKKKKAFLHRYTSVACAVGPSVTISSTDFSFQNLVFWNLFEFSAAEITQKSISPTF